MNKIIRKKLFFSFVTLIILLFVFEAVLSLGGYFYFYVYSNLDNPEIEEDTFHILFLGESAIAGAMVGIENAFPFQVEKILQQRYPNKKIRSYNRGVGGIETTAILRNLDKNRVKYKPNLVVLMAGYNDHFVENGKISNIERLYSSFKVYRLISSLKDFKRLSRDTYIRPDLEVKYAEGAECSWRHCKSFNPLSQVIFNLENIIRIVRSHGCEIWFAGYLQPDAREKVNPVLQKTAEENNITYIDDYYMIDMATWANCYVYPGYEFNYTYLVHLLSSYAKGMNSTNSAGHSKTGVDYACSLFSNDGWHPSKEGHRIIAEKIAERIIREGIIDRWQP